MTDTNPVVPQRILVNFGFRVNDVPRFLTNLPQKFAVADGRILLQGVLVEVEDATGRARSIERLSRSLPPEPD